LLTDGQWDWRWDLAHEIDWVTGDRVQECVRALGGVRCGGTAYLMGQRKSAGPGGEPVGHSGGLLAQGASRFFPWVRRADALAQTGSLPT